MKDVRIPREFLFGRFQTVSPSGEYKEMKADPKIHYITMVMARTAMLSTSSAKLAFGATIAVRYNAVRK
jgi:hypothetical protein